MIAAPINVRRETPSGECFLCAMDSQPCAVKMLEGTIISVREFNTQGEMLPYITLEAGGELATVRLTQFYRSLVKLLNGLGAELRRHRLTLRIYHLPAALAVTEHKGQTLHRYIASEHTLAILEPDTLLNITDLNHADYCSRQYLLNRLASSPQSAAAIRGNLVHSSFKELLKEHDRGELMKGRIERGEETPLATLRHHFEMALERSSIDLAVTNTPVEELRADAAPHLQSLANWFEKQHTSLWDMPAQPTSDEESEAGDAASENMVRAETFLLAPEIGLRGRLDVLWRQRSRQRLLELKTGGASGDLPKSAHRWQVQGYFSLLAVRRDPKMKNALATLLYSGTPGAATDFNLRFTITQFQRVNETRNLLAFSHVTGIAPAPPGPSRCTKCAMLEQCQSVSSLLDWLPPQPDKGDENGQHEQAQAVSQVVERYSATDRAFFKQYYHLLHQEEREIEAQQARLWQTPVKERVEQGSAIRDLRLIEKAVPTGQGEWLQTFACENTSELREGDEILLSDGDPVTGEVVTGTILSISSEQVTTWTPELIAHPRLLDRYATSIVHVRTLQNLLRWLQADSHLRGLVAGTLRPRFSAVAYAYQAHLNEQQNLAVERALQMRDYLLIHGPPGTGKTSVIAQIVRQLCQQGQRVLLAAFTNQAVDNMLKRLESEGFSNFVRLGHDRSVDNAIQHRLLKRLVEQKEERQSAREVLQNAPVVASTTATWSSDKYMPVAFTGSTGKADAQDDAALKFDVAIIDEAGQLTMPAMLGALRFAKRFILVGDEKQLPPLVLSKEAGQAGLSDSLFSILKQADECYTREHREAVSACVPLKMQYRMNRWISQFASHTFYGGELHPHPTVANRVLTFSASRSGVDDEKRSITRALDARIPLVFLDARGEPGIQEGIKTSNGEARIVREVVAGLLARGIEEGDIGIIAPYRAQVANLRRHLFADDAESGWRALSPTTRLSVDTVDRFQGGERSVIIISFATSVTPPLESQLRDHLTNLHRLNVALTRAQRKLILIGNAAALAELPVFRQLLVHCRDEHAGIVY
ncbi:MAG: AAA domain-containing protein [Ktedonobacteraceae bacterium]